MKHKYKVNITWLNDRMLYNNKAKGIDIPIVDSSDTMDIVLDLPIEINENITLGELSKHRQEISTELLKLAEFELNKGLDKYPTAKHLRQFEKVSKLIEMSSSDVIKGLSILVILQNTCCAFEIDYHHKVESGRYVLNYYSSSIGIYGVG